jgi:hypothetical protein
MQGQRRKEKGQILVLFVFGLVSLLGFTALAIDGSMIYADRRYVQSVSDAAAFAGGGAASQVLENGIPSSTTTLRHQNFKCPPRDAVTGKQLVNLSSSDPAIRTVSAAIMAAYQTAVQRAADNSFSGLEYSIDNSYGVYVDCRVEYVGGAYYDKYIDVHVRLTKNTQTAFAHLVFGRDSIQNTVDSVVRVRPRTAAAMGYAIASLNKTCSTSKDGVTFSGNSDTHVEGSGIFSNSCMVANGNLTANVAPNTELYINYFQDGGLADNCSNFTKTPPELCMDPYPSRSTAPLPDFTIEPPDCSKVTNTYTLKSNGTRVYGPGVYTNGLEPSTSGPNASTRTNPVVLQPGLYCITNGNFGANANEYIVGEDVTIYVQTGSVTVNGGADLRLTASTDPAPVNGALRGMLFYLPPTNANAVSITGNQYSRYSGTIYAPSSDITLGGTQDTITPEGETLSGFKYSTQIIGKNVKIDGNSVISIRYDQSEVWENPSALDLYR